MNTLKIKDIKEIPNNYTGILERSDGIKIWYKEGKPHRLDCPAIGCSTWYIDGIKYKGSKTLQNLLLRSVFLSINKKGRYNRIPHSSKLSLHNKVLGGVSTIPIPYPLHSS